MLRKRFIILALGEDIHSGLRGLSGLMLGVMLVGGIMLSSTLFAETEISGAVSGIWDAEGSPYIVTDSTWVPEDDTLTIEAGVTVRFNPGIGLDVMGNVFAMGTEEDSVWFLSNDEEEHWQGIWFWREYNENLPDKLETFSYCAIREVEYGMAFQALFDFQLDNTVINANTDALWGLYPNDRGSGLVLHSCKIFAPSQMSARTVEVYDSFIHCYNDSIGGIGAILQRIERSTIYGGVAGYNGQLILIDSQILRLPSGRIDLIPNVLGVWFSNVQIENSIVENRVAIDDGNDARNEIKDSEIGIEDHEFDWALVADHAEMILKNNIFRGSLRIEDSKANMEDCVIITNDSNRQNVFFGSNERDEDVNINRCTILGHGSRNLFELGNNASRMIVNNCLIQGRISITEFDNVFYQISNNVVYSRIGGRGRYLTPFHVEDGILELHNNIFLALTDSLYLFRYSEFNIIEPIFNCIWGFDSLNNIFNDPRGNIDSTNIVLDPLIVSYDPIDPHLTEDSPCIDAGNPNSPLDPDSTRADIGMFYFPHENNIKNIFGEPPAEFEIVGVYPNPFNERLFIKFRLPSSEFLTVQIFDISGRLVRNFPKRAMEYGEHILTIDADGLPSGNYYIKLNNSRQIIKYNAILLH